MHTIQFEAIFKHDLQIRHDLFFYRIGHFSKGSKSYTYQSFLKGQQ
nr:hypothetical protein [Staphylococcus schleiferi]